MNASAVPIRRGLVARLAVFLVLLVASGLGGHARLAAAPPASQALAVCVAEQRPGDTPRAMLAATARFDCTRPDTAWGPGNYWVRLPIPRGALAAWTRAAGDRPRLAFSPQWQRLLTFYARDTTGRIFTTTYDNADLSQLLHIGATVGLTLDNRWHPVTDVLVRIDGAVNAGGLLGQPRLTGSERFHIEERLATAIYAAFAGLGVGLFCYNFVLWLTVRRRFQFTYCLSLLAMLAYVWASSGAMAVQFPWVTQDARVATSYTLLAFVGALALQFVTDIIEHNAIPAGLRRFARHYGIAFVAAALAVWCVPDDWRYLADRCFVASFMGLPPLVLALTWYAWRGGSRTVRLLAIAWAVPLAVGMLRIAHALHLVPLGFLIQYSLAFGMAAEALLSSLAMSYRVKLLTEERDRALADEQAARHLANIDSLTGLLNRRALLEQVIAWASPEPLRLLIVDVDHFKQVNDSHGHHVGDEVLRELAEVLAIRADLRASVARLGGEEFALVGTAEELGEGIALGILADLRARPLAGVRVTASVGMAEGMVRCEDEWRELYRRADDALYRAKAEGRNRAVHAGPETAEEAALRQPTGAHSRAVA